MWLVDWLIEWMNEWRNEWMNERTNESMNQWINEPMNQWTNESMNQRINESMKFADLIFQKRSETLSSLVTLCEIKLSLQSCALFVDHFCRSRPAPVETETLLWRPRKPLYPPKNRGFRARRVFKSEFTRSQPVDVVDMMARMLAMRIVRNSEVV